MRRLFSDFFRPSGARQRRTIDLRQGVHCLPNGMTVALSRGVCAGPAVATRWLQAACLVSRLDATGPRTAKSSSAVLLIAVAAALATAGCRTPESVRVAWDAPMPAVKGYRILVDDRPVMTIPPPPLDPACSCAAVWVPVPPGEHKVTVIAYNELGDGAPSVITVNNRPALWRRLRQ